MISLSSGNAMNISVMLTFKCDYCKREYEVQKSINGYKYDNRREELTEPEDPCKACEQIGEKAKKKTLFKIKRGELEVEE